MGRRPKTNGFNTPFAELRAQWKAAAPPPPKKVLPPLPPPPTDNQVFAEAMRDVAPLSERRKRVEPRKRLKGRTDDEDAQVMADLRALVAGDSPFRLEATGEAVWGAVDGVNRRTVERLRTGGMAYRRHLDLHGHTREEAKDALLKFLAQARRDGERCVLVVTGRGKGSPGGVAVLREALPRWLSRFPLRAHTLAFSTARQVDGGCGAFYVLLRKAGQRPYGPSPTLADDETFE